MKEAVRQMRLALAESLLGAALRVAPDRSDLRLALAGFLQRYLAYTILKKVP